jgi:DNA-binding MarR family transcriptional regulator
VDHDKTSQPEVSGDLKTQALWTFFTNHGHVLIALAKDPDITLRDIAESVGITERAVHKIISELEEEGYLTRIRVGRKNQYKLSVDRPLRHPLESHRSVGDVIRLILAP